MPALIEAMQAQEAQVRRYATRALSHLGDARATDVLIEALEDPSYSVRWLAAEGLVAIGPEAVAPLLRAMSARVVRAWFRQGAFHVLNKVEGVGNAEAQWLRRIAARVKRDPAEELPLLARRALDEWQRLWAGASG
ncbi:MAG: HEAT repeat domain-containing protein [Ardenticatenia bacterium]|nr:HEAT repeat domain-containing protein [Ardenticatenia bacterium]